MSHQIGSDHWRHTMEQFINLEDVVLPMIDQCDFLTLISLSHTTIALRQGAKLTMSNRIHAVLAAYFPAKKTPVFMRELEMAGATLYGSVVNAMLVPNRDWQPRNLNISMRNRTVLGSRLWVFLYRMGYEWESTALSTVDGLRALHTLQAKKVSATVLIAESAEDSVLAPIFASGSTAKMNVFTRKGLYCPYPDLLRDGIALHISPEATDDDLTKDNNRHFKVLRDTSSGAFPNGCGLSCPKIWRRVRGTRGFAMFSWTLKARKVNWEGDIAGGSSTAFKWRLGSYCLNTECESYGV